MSVIFFIEEKRSGSRQGKGTLGIEYTNDPRALREEPEDGSVVVKKITVDFSRGVICMWRVVCGERGRGTESCWGGGADGDALKAPASVESEGECTRDETSRDAGMMRGILSFR